MTWAGWLLMTLSCGVVVSLMVFCYRRVLRTPRPEEHMHAPLEIDTRDADT
ncbi:MAG TPA: hypothetical protein PLL20_16005 [Phycisphaerae bacterium]|nr:hypothetical protein [Phycisphaerae bacterium]HRR84821.1 hypothetical protein [Phycisphaerae bacterium]